MPTAEFTQLSVQVSESAKTHSGTINCPNRASPGKLFSRYHFGPYGNDEHNMVTIGGIFHMTFQDEKTMLDASRILWDFFNG